MGGSTREARIINVTNRTVFVHSFTGSSTYTTVLYPKELSDQIKSLNDQIVRLNQQLVTKDDKIKALEERVSKLEVDSDSVEEYSRRANLQIRGPAENDGGEDTDQLVLTLFNDNMGITPPIERHEIERRHRLGRKNRRKRSPAYEHETGHRALHDRTSSGRRFPGADEAETSQ